MRIKVKKIRSIWGKSVGLMLSKPENLAFIFQDERKRSLHMLFVFFSIDVLFLDSKRRVVEKATLKPFQLYTSKKKAQYVFELRKGQAKKIKIGSRIQF